jgi:hypothetical protein
MDLEWWLISTNELYPSTVPVPIIRPLSARRDSCFRRRLEFVLSDPSIPEGVIPYAATLALRAGFVELYPIAIRRGLTYDGAGKKQIKGEMYLGGVAHVSNETLERGIQECGVGTREARFLKELRDASTMADGQERMPRPSATD